MGSAWCYLPTVAHIVVDVWAIAWMIAFDDSNCPRVFDAWNAVLLTLVLASMCHCAITVAAGERGTKLMYLAGFVAAISSCCSFAMLVVRRFGAIRLQFDCANNLLWGTSGWVIALFFPFELLCALAYAAHFNRARDAVANSGV